MDLIAMIRYTRTGEVRRYNAGPIETYGGGREEQLQRVRFHWTEGNYGCDCNRRDVFRQAGGEASYPGSPCGSIEFSVRLQLEDGTEVL
jgi:hypothetical protein